MIKKFEFGDTTQISSHFNVKEFRCKWIIVNKVDNKREKIKKVLQIEQEIKGH